MTDATAQLSDNQTTDCSLDITGNEAYIVPPPQGDNQKAEKYLGQLTFLIRQDKINLCHTDLKKFDPTSLQDHYRIELKEYEIEVSHSKHPTTDQDFYVMIFNNLKNVSDNLSSKVILAYIHLTPQQFDDFKSTADEYLEQKRKEAEEKRFKQALEPIDNLLLDLTQAQEDQVIQPSPDQPTTQYQDPL